jgi:hypothetical protein
MQSPEEHVALEDADWEVTPEGLYIATRGFLTRRGYCCANRCRNCPYVNWRAQPDWQPISIERVRSTYVKGKTIAGVQQMLDYHLDQLANGAITEQPHHQQMIQHYRALLERWRV